MHRLRGDDGATTVLVAILMVALLGVGTLVLDVGSLYAERRQLQNGADAAALAVAPDCAASVCDTSTAPGSRTGQYANLNANDGLSTVTEVCGVGGGLSGCSPSGGTWDCRPVPAGPLAAQYVQVRTATRRSGGSNLMPPLLARVLDPAYAGTTVRACARASWGGAASITGLSMTISYCEWDLATGGGSAFATPPPYPPNPPTSVERVLKIHTTTTGSCPAGGHAGSDAPGAFGWLNESGPCRNTVDANGTYQGDPGVSLSSACKTAMDAASSSPYPVMHIPVYDSVSGTGTNTQYHLKGFAAFVLTGYWLPGGKKASWLYPSNPAKCSGADKCVYGFFTKELVPVSGVVGGPSMGITAVQLSG